MVIKKIQIGSRLFYLLKTAGDAIRGWLSKHVRQITKLADQTPNQVVGLERIKKVKEKRLKQSCGFKSF